MTLNFVLLTKAYDLYDFKYWYEYHTKRFPNSVVWVFDNDSIVDISGLVPRERYFRISGFPAQKTLYADIMNGKYGRLFEEWDPVCFIDDDEFIYLRDPNSEGHDIDLLKVIQKGFEKYDTLCLPHINMSQKELPADRDTSLGMPSDATYHRRDDNTTVKCFVKYMSGRTYDWRVQTGIDEAAHVPFIDGARNAAVFTCWYDKTVGCSTGLFFPMGNTSFASIDFNSNIRLYHYHLKSRWDWDQKIKRGSCACVVPWYSEKVEENCFYGGYEIFDSSMAVEFRVYVDVKPRTDGKLHDEYQPIQENDTTKRRDAAASEEKYKPDSDKIDYEDFRFGTFDVKMNRAKLWIKSNAPQIDIDSPEKNIANFINYCKLSDMNPKKVLWADKIAVYKELYDLGLENIRIPLLYERYKPSNDDLAHAIELAQRSDCILKCNHASGYNIRFKSGEKVNYDFLINRIRKWLDTNYAYVAGYEWQYEPIVPGILIQPSLFSASQNPVDYQFWCQDGKIVAVELQRKISKVIIEHIAFTDVDGNDNYWYIGTPPMQRGLNRAQLEAVEAMKPIVEKIAREFRFVRVDLFWINGRVYFCEATFCPCSGVLDYTDKRLSIENYSIL